MSESENKESDYELAMKILNQLETFHRPGIKDRAYAVVMVNGKTQTYDMDSRSFLRWVRREFRMLYDMPAENSHVKTAIVDAASDAQFGNREEGLWVRVAEQSDAWYLDLNNQAGQAVKITSGGWEVVEDVPLHFQRPVGALSLPVPERGGSLSQLREVLGIEDSEVWQMLAIWLIGAFRPSGPYPLLILVGPQGSSKSTKTRILRALVDPHTSPIRSLPSGVRDLAISANNNWVLAFDNLSELKNWLSDAFCQLSTGMGYTTRRLYTDDAEAMFYLSRPVIVNSIEEVVMRGDLLDRSLTVCLKPIDPSQRRTEEEIWSAFNERLPGILGAVLDVVSAARGAVDSVPMHGLPRLADFARFAIAAEEKLGFEKGTVLSLFDKVKTDADWLVVEHNPVAGAVYDMGRSKKYWKGSAAELLVLLAEYTAEGTSGVTRVLPKSPRALTSHLRRIDASLKRLGVEINFLDRTAKKRPIEIKAVAQGDGNHSDDAAMPS